MPDTSSGAVDAKQYKIIDNLNNIFYYGTWKQCIIFLESNYISPKPFLYLKNKKGIPAEKGKYRGWKVETL